VTVPRDHRRFALTDVTFGGQAVGGATIDVWVDASGATRWCARVLMPSSDTPEGGVLAGKTRDGRILQGPVSRFGEATALRARGPVLIEWGGVGELLPLEPPDMD
jgi:hypothetical protein